MRKALEQARRGRMHILEKMQEALPASRQNISAFAPRIVTIRIPVDKIRDVIGPGGKMIRSIIERTGVKIDVEDDGRVNVASADGESAQKAISIIQELTATPELNKTYLGKVQRITDFGAFVEIMPGTDGLLHVSEIANHRVKDVRDELKEGEQLLVKVINIDPTGKIRLSRKALLQEEAAKAPAAPKGVTQAPERLRRGDALAHRRVAVEQPLHDSRRMLFGEVLRAEAPHRRDERGRDCASGRARTGRRCARTRATSRAPTGTITSDTAPAASSSSGRPATSSTPRRPSGCASALSTRAAR